MSIAITEDHRALADTVSDFMSRRNARGAARALLTAPDEGLPEFWSELAGLGWLGLHLPEEFGGSGYGMEELVVVVEGLGRAVCPGPAVPTMIASAAINAAGSAATKTRWLAGLADGSTIGAFALDGAITVTDGAASGSAGVVLSGALANVIVALDGDDLVVIDCSSGVSTTVPANMDLARRSARVALDGAPAEVIAGGGQALLDAARLLLAAEAMGVARETTGLAAEYAKVRQQFGRPIAMFQGVKHHCANMIVATELATAAVWDAARATKDGGAQQSLTAALAAGQALAASDLCTNLNIQVHGGIGFTWEHDSHLYLRRATAIQAILSADRAAIQATDLVRSGTRRARTIDLPPEAEAMRDEIRTFAQKVAAISGDAAQRDALIAEGYAMPHWPKPWGRAAGAVEQLVIEQEFAAAGVKRPAYGITGWVILTLIQYATDDQVARWVMPALRQDVIWCQLFSEPDAGSDAAGVKTKATRVAGGWLLNGQKVWTSGAHVASFGFITVRTNPDLPKHQGITTMVVDMHAEGVEVRPLKQNSGSSDFNEVFFNDVFVPDDDVVGPIDNGWTVARATLGNESVSIGGGQGGMSVPGEAMIPGFDANPARLPGGAGRIGRYIALTESMRSMNLRTANRAVAGGGPGPEGNIAKLVLSEAGHEAAAILAALSGPDGAFTDGASLVSSMLVLSHRAMSIAGGTSEIKRNQIGERILGLPRDPLIN